MSSLEKAVRQAKHRLRLNLFLIFLSQGLVFVSAILVVPVATIRLLGIERNPLVLLWGLVLAVPYALLRVYLADIDDQKASLELDRRFRLFERVSTAWALRSEDRPMVRLLHQDAENVISGVRIGDRFPIRFPRTLPVAIIPLTVLVPVSLWLPPLPRSQANRAETTKVTSDDLDREKIEEVVKILRREEARIGEKKETRSATGVAELRQPLAELAKKLEEGKLTKKQAFSGLSDQKKKLLEKKERLARLKQTRTRLGRDLSQLKYTREIRKSLERGDFSKAATGLNDLARLAAAGELSATQMEQLAEELDSLSKALQGNPGLQKALGEAIEALRGGQSGTGRGRPLSPEQLERLRKALAQASQGLDDLQRLSDRMEELDDLLQDIDLAKLGLSDNLSQCRSCGKVCSGTGCSSCSGGNSGKTASTGSGGGTSGLKGAGRGQGNVAERYRNPNATSEDWKVSPRWHPGELLGVIETEGESAIVDSVVGESAAFVEAGEGEQTIVQEEIPPGYESIVRGYFGEGQ